MHDPILVLECTGVETSVCTAAYISHSDVFFFFFFFFLFLSFLFDVNSAGVRVCEFSLIPFCIYFLFQYKAHLGIKTPIIS